MGKTGSLKISIITVCRNSERYIAETIKSVVSQNYGNIEYIVIDGNSTDGTSTIIERYASQIDKFVSEPDNSMYEAINKGLKLATGDYILILNSDDVLNSDTTISDAVKMMIKYKADYYYGNIIKRKEKEQKKVSLFPVTYSWLLYSTHSTFVPHPCLFVSAKLNEELNGYDTRYKYAADYDYILRAISRKGIKGKHLNLVITKFRIHDESISGSGKITPERLAILKENDYYKRPYIFRKLFYLIVWIYYKGRNIGQNYRAISE